MSFSFYDMETKTVKSIDTELEKTSKNTNLADFGDYKQAENLSAQSKSRIEEVFSKYSKNSVKELTKVEENKDFLTKDYKRKDEDKKKIAVLRLKLAVFNYIFITIALLAFCIYNIFAIANLRAAVAVNSATQIGLQVNNDIPPFPPLNVNLQI